MWKKPTPTGSLRVIAFETSTPDRVGRHFSDDAYDTWWRDHVRICHGFDPADPTHAEVTVDMGKANRLGTGSAVVGGQTFTGLGVDVRNPHLACVTDLTPAELAALDVAAPVSFDTAQFPEGVNVEIVAVLSDTAVDMRVHERGVGETRSCGTGTVAAAVAALRSDGASTGTLRVRVPGGEVTVTVTDATSFLRGPSVLLARGELSEEWWGTHHR